MKSKIYAVSMIALLSALMSVRAEMSGESGRSSRFVSKLETAASSADQCEFSVEIERVMFKLNSLKDKYKVVRIRAENRKGETIKMSAEKDGIELVLADGKIIKGTFNLKSQNGPVWDSLSDEMRNVLAYPLTIRAAKVRDGSLAREEVVYFFAFFPADKVPDIPRSFHYRIESLGKTLTLEERAVAKR